jgi:ribulose-phosphate 3-epimerase
VHRYVEAGCEIVIVHAEACTHLHRTLANIRELGASPAVALNPATPVDAVAEIAGDVDMVLCMTVNPGWGGQEFLEHSIGKLERLRVLLGPDVSVEVDGGIDTDTARRCAAAGATVFVAGTAVFSAPDPADKVKELAAAISS